MKFLFDQNLSRKLPLRIEDIFPGSSHVVNCGLETASDIEIRFFAAEHGYTIVTKDKDFVSLNELFGWPPKVIVLRKPNASTNEYLRLILALREQLEAFSSDNESGIFVVS